MELGSIEVIKRMVGIGLGVSVVPGFAVREELRAGALKAARLPWLPARTVGLIQRRNGYLPPAGLMFLRLLKNHIPLVLLSPFIPADRISE